MLSAKLQVDMPVAPYLRLHYDDLNIKSALLIRL